MMPDLIMRLRAYYVNRLGSELEEESNLWHPPICDEAATRIEKLQAQVIVQQQKKKKLPTRESCASCYFFRRDDVGNNHCREDVVKIYFDGEKLVSKWPHTDPAQWCGKYKRNDDDS